MMTFFSPNVPFPSVFSYHATLSASHEPERTSMSPPSMSAAVTNCPCGDVACGKRNFT